MAISIFSMFVVAILAAILEIHNSYAIETHFITLLRWLSLKLDTESFWKH